MQGPSCDPPRQCLWVHVCSPPTWCLPEPRPGQPILSQSLMLWTKGSGPLTFSVLKSHPQYNGIWGCSIWEVIRSCPYEWHQCPP